MEHISLLTKTFEVKRGAPHEKSASVVEIKKCLGEDSRSFGYWLKMIGKVSYTEIIGILKDLETLPDKYSKGATLTNILRRKNGLQIHSRTPTDTLSQGNS